MKKIISCSFIILLMMCLFSTSNVFASSTSTNDIISNGTKSQLVTIKNKEMKSMQDYEETYGSKVYGTVAYVLNKVRIYSIPIAFLGIAISAIYQFVLGARHLETRDKGFNSMIAIVTLLVICQVLPLVFAIVVKGWRN